MNSSVKQHSRTFSLVAIAGVLAGCAAKGPELETVEYVDLERFMGEWYVIANIPTRLEVGAHNAIEHYALNEDGSIATTFTFREDAFDGEPKRYEPTGFVLDTASNARWGMRFVWPIKADYRIVYLDDDYSQTVIARQKRDFVWIMARSPSIPASDYEKLVEFVGSIGYDTTLIERVPQRW